MVTAAGAALRFSNTVFALTLGTTEQGSADLIAGNPAVIELAGNNSWRLIVRPDRPVATHRRYERVVVEGATSECAQRPNLVGRNVECIADAADQNLGSQIRL